MEYYPLDHDADEIRLLELIPSNGDADGFVECVLAHYPLHGLIRTDKCISKTYGSYPEENHDPSSSRYDWGDYCALSYVWGSSAPKDLRTIFVNGEPTEVTANLEAALRHLRDSLEAASGLMFWIDALCINQSSLEERSREVKRMKRIYETAKSIVVYLGCELENFDTLQNLMNQLGRASQTGKSTLEFINPWHRGLDAFQKAARSIYDLLSRPYWQRLWIIQELAMGDDNTRVLCGDTRLRWGAIWRIAGALAEGFASTRRELEAELSKDQVDELSETVWRIG
ncbi:HET-domain-containing protein [Zopfia rhizophila CBS 207.26]|uniref:HET-domain-containing protein n=1 Tax=Zopfia rhizophila CBS 207.26 TaxID=1314779 RepID=A0A6A6EGK5_9PEZI|nr:HET-domain-containing protein [Zopfia rhizophila CBS 207.26]